MNMNMIAIAALFLVSLFLKGVFCEETERVSVNDGGSVTLHTGLTSELQRDDDIMWIFNGNLTARINKEIKSDPVYSPDKRFTDRLEMNPQTGDLTITNITSEHTGQYELEIITNKIIRKLFSVSLSQVKRDSVSLHINVTDEHRNDKIHWKIRHNNSSVAEVITVNGTISTPFIDERFRDRLMLDDQTGDLNITDMKNSGQYEADVTIGSNTHTIHKTFSFTDSEAREGFNKDEGDGSSSGLSSGVIPGICVALLVVCVCVGVGVVIYRRRTMRHQESEAEEHEMESREPLRNGDVSNRDVSPV